MFKLLLKTLRATAILILVASAGFAQSQIPKPQGLVNDFAGKLTPQTKQQLENLLTYFRHRSNIEIAVVTVPFEFMANQPIEAYSLQLGREWGVGNKAGGLLLLVAIKSKAADGTYGGATRLEVSRQLEKDISNELAGEIIRQFRSELKRGLFDEALTKGVHTLILTLAQKRGISTQGLDMSAAATTSKDAVRVENGTPTATYQPTLPSPSNPANHQNPPNKAWSFSTVLIFIIGLPLLIISFIAVVFIRAISKLNGGGNGAGNPTRNHFIATDNQQPSNDYQSNHSSWSESHTFSNFSDSASSTSLTDSSSASSWSDSGSASSSDSTSSSDFSGGGSTDSW